MTTPLKKLWIGTLVHQNHNHSRHDGEKWLKIDDGSSVAQGWSLKKNFGSSPTSSEKEIPGVGRTSRVGICLL